MNDRLSQFLSAENISQSMFADTIGVARASVSHIIAGRNKPGYDFLCSIMEHYPSLNPEWLILGKGKMYKSSADERLPNMAARLEPIPQPSKNQIVEESHTFDLPEEDLFSSSRETTVHDSEPEKVEVLKQEESKVIDNQRTISKIIVFYSDNTFQELKG